MTTESEAQTERAVEVQEKYSHELMEKANVQGTAVGLAKKEGNYTDIIAVVVLVSVKLPESELAPEDICPKELEGVRVDVQEVGFLSAQ
ncbi:MAG: hypothetical protein K8L99_12825 [Anaerolineae bacterium]|nr:hypothetical protein [Anaerolineae bacterium]